MIGERVGFALLLLQLEAAHRERQRHVDYFRRVRVLGDEAQFVGVAERGGRVLVKVRDASQRGRQRAVAVTVPLQIARSRQRRRWRRRLRWRWRHDAC